MASIASIKNMWAARQVSDQGAFVTSVNFPEVEYSANPYDYLGYDEDYVMQDEAGADMIIVRRVTHLVDGVTGKAL